VNTRPAVIRIAGVALLSLVFALATEAYARLTSADCSGVVETPASGPTVLQCIRRGGCTACQSDSSQICPDGSGNSAAACKCSNPASGVSPCCHVVLCFSTTNYPKAAGDCGTGACPSGVTCTLEFDPLSTPPSHTAECFN
jgi:hypothetical protein